jgi:hypothetical protein
VIRTWQARPARASDAPETLDWLNAILAPERGIVISARPLEVTSFEVDGFRMAGRRDPRLLLRDQR